MSKIIKKQIERSMPLFVIICLLCSSTIYGLLFNYGINISVKNNKISVSVGRQEVKAQTDTATTTVMVRNAPPTFSVEAAEVGASTSTTPINLGYSIGFTANANDTENNDYYLLICKTPGATASSTGGAPACTTGPTLCVSGVTAIAGQASCTYNNVVDPTSIGGADDEIQDWYAYVCDNHTVEGSCSDTYSQGAAPNDGNNSSPFYVNHAPVYTAINTAVNNRDPGQMFTVTASLTDVDTRGGNDELQVDVCSSNVGWATSTGCAAGTQLCTGTSTLADGSVSCQFATSTIALGWVAVDGTYPYYAFVKDWHGMPAAANSRTANYVVNNVAPTVTGVTLNSGSTITLNLKTAPRIVVTATATISDMNACADATTATATIYWSGSTGWNCSADEDNCYKIGTANCVRQNATCGVYPDATVEFICTTTMAFHAVPTDGTAGNPYSGTWWEAAVTGIDEALRGTASSAPNTVDVAGVSALAVEENQIPYGSIRGGQNSSTTNATTTIDNYGNVPINTTFEGVDMLRQGGGGWIGSDQQWYSLSNFTYGAGTWQLASGSPSAARNLDLIRPTTALSDISDQVFWGIAIPAGKLSGIYDGSNIFRSVVDAGAGW